jgi:hypothetical protein
VAHYRIIHADSGLLAKIADARHSRFVRHGIERLAGQMEHDGMKGISNVGDRVASQIVD